MTFILCCVALITAILAYYFSNSEIDQKTEINKEAELYLKVTPAFHLS